MTPTILTLNMAVFLLYLSGPGLEQLGSTWSLRWCFRSSAKNTEARARGHAAFAKLTLDGVAALQGRV